MKNCFTLLPAVFCVCFMISCASTPPTPPDYTYGKEEIQVQISADPQLNLYQGSPHTLLVCVHQLSDPNAFNRLAGDTNGIYQLLECSQFDQSVTHSKRIIVQPDQKVAYTLDRAEGTKYVAVGAGYYDVRKENVVRLYEVPIVVESLGAFSTTRISKPDILTINLDLGPTHIISVSEEKE